MTKLFWLLLTIFHFQSHAYETIKGDPKSQVQISMIGDYQCPFSSYGYKIIRELFEDGQYRFSFKHINYPLNFHDQALSAAKYVICADKQGKYWPLHDGLYALSREKSLTQLQIQKKIKELKLDLKKLNQCFDSEETKKHIDNDFSFVKENKLLDATPSFIIEGPRGKKILNGAYPKSEFEKTMEAVL